jgi:hypothetical protein
MTMTIPGGKEKGKTVQEASERTLHWWHENAKQDDLRNACAEELGRRAAGGQPATSAAPPPPRPAPGALQKVDTTQLVTGTFGDPGAATRALESAAAQYHLVTPATVVGHLPPGCEVQISLVHVDPYGPDVYSITGDRDNAKPGDTVGLSKVALDRIFSAMGGKWLSSHRTDDGSHPHYCAWEAWGEYPGFDMQARRVVGNVDIDTREDGAIRGAAAEEIRSKAARRREKGDGGDAQLLELRKFLIRHAERKAMNRVVGNCGVRRAYKRSELTKPFAVAQLAFTGRSSDPEERRTFVNMVGERFLGVRSELYGKPASVQAPTPQLQAPPPIGSAPMYRETHGEAVRTPVPVRPAAPPPPQQQAAPEQDGPPDDYEPPKAAASDPNADLAREAKDAGAY